MFFLIHVVEYLWRIGWVTGIDAKGSCALAQLREQQGFAEPSPVKPGRKVVFAFQ